MELSISNVVNISVSQAGMGLGSYNTSNIAIYSREAYQESFGDEGFKIYRSPEGVGKDFGTGSNTYKMAVAIFSQQPSILANGGYLVVIASSEEVTVSVGEGAESGDYKLNIGEGSILVSHDSTIEDIRDLIEAVDPSISIDGDASEYVLKTSKLGKLVISISDNTLVDSASATVDVDGALVHESPLETFLKSKSVVQYVGILTSFIPLEEEALELAVAVQGDKKIYGYASHHVSEFDADNGIFKKILDQGLNKTRAFFHGPTEVDALVMASAYLSRAMSTIYAGSNTTITMHLKDLAGVSPNPAMDETILQKAKDYGVDVYCSIQGVPKVFTSGANKFFDQVHNLIWFVGALEVEMFNLLAQNSTKIAQTEDGVSLMKSVVREVCEQAVTNGYASAGRWTRPETFGNQKDFFDNISQRGYYIYSQPVAQQLPSDRQARKAPVIQLALKEAGAIHDSTLIVNINE